MGLHTAYSGEPYELAGKRLVFTNWFYVRPGNFGWFDDKGNNIAVAGSAGPWDAHFRKFDSPYGVRLVAQPAQRRGPVLSIERPWECRGLGISTIINENGTYRAWGGCTSGTEWGSACYFESKDGINWIRPELDIVEFDGNAGNNLINLPNGGSVFHDPSGDPGEQYKWLSESQISREEFERYRSHRPGDWELRADRTDANMVMAVCGAVSPDGLRWTRLPDPLVVEHSDTQVIGYYDSQIRKYVVYTRNYMVGRRSERGNDDPNGWLDVARRAIGRTESEVFRNLPLSEVVMEPTPAMPPSDVLYTNCRTAVPGAPDHHLMFPAVWHTGDDTTSVVLASSYNGKAWNYVPGPSVLGTAPFGEWDGGCVFAHPNLVELPTGDFVLPYTGFTFPHKYPRAQWSFAPGLAVWPKGRLVALEAAERGEFATVAIIPPGRKLRINAQTQRGGHVLVEAADLRRNAIPGRSFRDAVPIVGDQYRTPVVWKEHDDLGHADGAPLVLRFEMERAQIFGLDFE